METQPDTFPVEAVDHLRFAVGNALQAAHFYSTAFGMRVTAYRGPETGSRELAEYVLESGGARFVITGPVVAGTWVGESVAKHGDGIVDIALRVPDAERAFRVAVERGATALAELDRIGRAIAGQKCRRPIESKTQFVAYPLAEQAKDEMHSHACPGFRVAVYRSTLAGATREFPVSVVVEDAHPLLGAEWGVGAPVAELRRRLGTPQAVSAEGFGYALRPDRAGRDTLRFEVAGGVVRAITWTWDVE